MCEGGIKLVVVGTVAIDAIETPHGIKERCFGGSAAYFAYAASFFSPVSLVGVVGRDFPPDYRKVLEERKIDLSHLEVQEGETFFWQGKYEGDLNSAKTLQTKLNVLAEFSPQLRYKELPPFLFLANIDPVLQQLVLDQARKPQRKFVACDTMNFWISSKREELIRVLGRVDGVVLNDGETRQLTGVSNLIRAAKVIQEWGPETVIIKKGEHGVLLFHGTQYFAMPAFPLDEVKDPTGAGDTFAGGFMGYLASTGDISFENLRKAVTYGSVTASFTVEDFGLERLRRLTGEEIEKRLEFFRKICNF